MNTLCMENYTAFFGLMGKILSQYPEKEFYQRLVKDEILDETPLTIHPPPFR